MTAPNYPAQVLAVLQNNPTAADLDFLVEAYTSIGYLAATAETAAETAEAQRKYDEAERTKDIMEANQVADIKMTAAQVASLVTVQTFDSRKAEIKARDKARKLKNLLDSIEQSINAIKFLGKHDSTTVSLPGRR